MNDGRTHVLQVFVNSEMREIEPGASVAMLLDMLNMQPRYVAVERNLELVPRAEHADCKLSDGDRLEIVTLVGGG